MADEVANIEATQQKEVAVIEAKQAINEADASNFITTLDKLQEFKRYSIALVLIGIFGLAILMLGIVIIVQVYRGDFANAVDTAKWMITILGTIVGTIVGFYFGSNVGTKPS